MSQNKEPTPKSQESEELSEHSESSTKSTENNKQRSHQKGPASEEETPSSTEDQPTVEVIEEEKTPQVSKSSKNSKEQILPRSFYKRDIITVSRDLLGKILVREVGKKVIKAKIVEVEAYAGIEDKACHAYNARKTERNKAMYLEGGHVYVYSIHGNIQCLNITASKEGDPSAALIRAVEITEGRELAIKNRGSAKLSKTQKEIANGPGRLCQAMEIDKRFNGHDLTEGEKLYVVEDTTKFEVLVTKRINIDKSEEYVHKPWRFCIKNNICISVKGKPADPETNDKKKD